MSFFTSSSRDSASFKAEVVDEETAGMGSASRRYLVVAGLALLLGLGSAWIWSARMKLAFLDPEYAAWAAKRHLIDDCKLGDLLILGDSRAGAGIMPSRLSIPAANVSMGGAKPVELYFVLRRAMACANMPHRVLLSIDAGHFNSTDTFWERSARFGTFSTRDLAEIERVASRSRDTTLFTMHRSDGFPSLLRDWLYVHSFPTLNFASMARAGLFLRYPENIKNYNQTLMASGQHLFGTSPQDSDVGDEANERSFRVLPLEAYFFDRILSDLQARGIIVDYVVMPINQATAAKLSAQLSIGFAAFLSQAARHHSNLHILIGPLPSLPNRFFGDNFLHLNEAGAERFTALINQALRVQPVRR